MSKFSTRGQNSEKLRYFSTSKISFLAFFKSLKNFHDCMCVCVCVCVCLPVCLSNSFKCWVGMGRWGWGGGVQVGMGLVRGRQQGGGSGFMVFGLGGRRRVLIVGGQSYYNGFGWWEIHWKGHRFKGRQFQWLSKGVRGDALI